jgi:hypothetical protein
MHSEQPGIVWLPDEAMQAPSKQGYLSLRTQEIMSHGIAQVSIGPLLGRELYRLARMWAGVVFLYRLIAVVRWLWLENPLR